MGGTANTVPFSETSSAVTKARDLIQLRIHQALGIHSEFNEVLRYESEKRICVSFEILILSILLVLLTWNVRGWLYVVVLETHVRCSDSYKFHSDSERGLGPIVAELSLGSPALMHFRVNHKYPREKDLENHSVALTIILRHVR